jgi:hypothetical protein
MSHGICYKWLTQKIVDLMSSSQHRGMAKAAIDPHLNSDVLFNNLKAV